MVTTRPHALSWEVLENDAVIDSKVPDLLLSPQVHLLLKETEATGLVDFLPRTYKRHEVFWNNRLIRTESVSLS